MSPIHKFDTKAFLSQSDNEWDRSTLAQLAPLAVGHEQFVIVGQESNSVSECEERAAIAHFDGRIPGEWVEGFAHLQTMLVPKDFPLKAWDRVINDCGKFLDQWGPRAVEVGWNELDLFGVHPQAPRGNISYSGLVLVLSGNVVSAMSENTASVRQLAGHDNIYRRQPNKPGCIPIWRL